MPFPGVAWHAILPRLPKKQTKVKVRDRTVIECFDSERSARNRKGCKRIDGNTFVGFMCQKQQQKSFSFVLPGRKISLKCTSKPRTRRRADFDKVEEAVIEFCN